MVRGVRDTWSALKRFKTGRTGGVAALVAALLAVAVVPAFAAKIEIESLSNRPDKVSGGDVLIRVRVPQGVALGDVKVKLNNADVTGGLFQDPASHALMGLVTGLKDGNNTINASANKTNPGALVVVNYPIQGPVFSGPQEKPFYCQTHQFRVYGGGPFFSAAQLTDPCVEATRVDYLYRNTATPGAFVALPTGPLPADLKMTTTTTGETVPYIVRLETGVINRSIYQIAILDDPSVAGPDLQNHTDPGWNNRLIYTFGGGCGGGQYIQGSSTGGVLNDAMLSRGFAVASGSLNVLGNNCNFVTSAETLMMVKEHFIETFGPPLYTMGFGCSGGSIQQHLIGDNYPGLLDGLTPSCSFPDVAGATTFDARLLYDYYNFKDKGVTWTEDQIRQVSGFGTYGHIVNQGTSWAARIDPVPNRPNYLNAAFSWLYNNVVPVDVRYVPDPAFPNSPPPNVTGARATTWDHVVNLLGEGANGFARRPLDNVGIQYGLGALNAGQISKEQFLDLNEKIGGLDIDANFTKQRMVADANALRAAYQTGFVTNFGLGLANVPILDWDQIYSDLNPGGDVHMKFHHFSVRERLKKANGNADNQVIWTGGDAAPRDLRLHPGRPPDGRLAHRAQGRHVVGPGPGEGRAGQAGHAGRRLLDGQRRRAEHADVHRRAADLRRHGHVVLQHRPPGFPVPALRGRRCAHDRHHQVPAPRHQADRLRRSLHAGRDDAPPRDLPHGCVRLVEAGRGSDGPDLDLDHLHGRRNLQPRQEVDATCGRAKGDPFARPASPRRTGICRARPPRAMGARRLHHQR